MIAYIGLGANIGDREKALYDALEHLSAAYAVTLLTMSRVIETEPWGDPDQPKFLNACARVETNLSPTLLLRACKETEQALGRTPSRRWGPRAIDIDILLYGDQIIETPELVIPHKHLHERVFVLAPLAEIAPDAVHPGLQQTIAELFLSL